MLLVNKTIDTLFGRKKTQESKTNLFNSEDAMRKHFLERDQESY